MGWLNPDANDQYRIDQMPGTDEVPAAGALEGLAAAPFKGLAGADAKLYSLADSLYHDPVAGPVLGYLPGGSFMRDLDLDPAEHAKAAAAVKVVSDWAATGQDPRVTGVAGRIAAGLAENVTIAGAGAAVGGPWGAAALLGSVDQHSGYKENIASGMDPGTAMELSLIRGGFAAASAFLPMKFGKNVLTSALGGGAASVTFGMAQRGLTSAVLSANGYQQQADQYKVFDKESMLSDAILGHAFGVMGHFAPGAEGRRGVDPANVDAAQAVEVEDHFNNSAPGVATTPEIANLHAMTLNEAMDAMSKGDTPDVPADVAQKLVDGVVPDPTHEAMAQGVAEAAKDIPGYDAAAADVPRVELPPLRLVDDDYATEAAHDGNVPMDDYNGQLLGHLVANYGDMNYTTEDGREVTVKQLADELQTQRNESDRFASLHDVAGACALAHGG